MKKRGTPFRGVLYAGVMLTADGPKLFEYNVRFGDPECQVLMLRMMSDIMPAMLAACDGELKHFDLRWYPEPALTVVMAAKGYPGDYAKGRASTGWTKRRKSRASKSSRPARSQRTAPSSPMAAACSTSAPRARPWSRRGNALTPRSIGSNGRKAFAGAISAGRRWSRNKRAIILASCGLTEQWTCIDSDAGISADLFPGFMLPNRINTQFGPHLCPRRRQGPAAVVAARIFRNACDVAPRRAATRRPLHADHRRPAGLRLVRHAGERQGSHALHQARDGANHHRGDGATRPRAFRARRT